MTPRAVAGRAAAVPLLALSAAACQAPSTPSGASARPATILVCESNNAVVCGTWTRSGDGYVARWQDGAEAAITVERFDATGVRFRRADAAGVSAGMTAVYEGTRTDRGVTDGEVRWSLRGDSWTGTWQATW